MKPKTIICAIILSTFTTGCTVNRTPHATSLAVPQPPSANEVTISNAMSDACQVELRPVETRSDGQRIETTGEVKPDDNRIFHVNSVIGGKLMADLVSLGDCVRAKQTLATVENLEVMRISAAYVHDSHVSEREISQIQAKLKLALANKLRLEKLFKEGIAAEKDVLTAETQWMLEDANLRAATREVEHQRSETRALLAAYGVDIGDIKNDEPIKLSPILCPRDGVVIKKNITIGDVISSSEPLYVVADLSKVWLDITIFDKDLAAIKEGSPVKFTTDGMPAQQFYGKIDYIQPLAQDGRTFVARAVVENGSFKLKPGMFGRVVVEPAGGAKQPFVPNAAVQNIDGKTVVFVKSQGGRFHAVPVTLGRQIDDGYFVSGLNAGQLIVTRGSYYVKEQLASPTGKQENH
jgi:membrane fusion protein, heavy metal efflux system